MQATREDREIADELNFERYHDLIEAERLNTTESERLEKVDEEWTKLLDRHQAKLALLDQHKEDKAVKKNFGFDYGTTKAPEVVEEEEGESEKESQLLKEVDILQYIDELSDKEKQVLNEMSAKYGITSYARLLRIAKKDRDNELKALRRQRGDDKPKDRPKSANERRRIRRRNERLGKQIDNQRHKRRSSPTYESYARDSDPAESSGEEEEEDANPSDFVIEFGTSTDEVTAAQKEEEERLLAIQKQNQTVNPVEKKLTPMEKLKMKMRAGLEKQIILDEKEKRQKEKEKEVHHLRELATSQGLPANAYMRPEPPTRDSLINGAGTNKARYRSPSRSPSPEVNAAEKSRYRSPSPSKERSKYRSPSPSKKSTKYRSPSPSEKNSRYRSPSPTTRNRSRSSHHSSRRRSSSRDGYRSSHSKRDNRRHDHVGSPQKKRYRSPSTEDRYRKKSYRH